MEESNNKIVDEGRREVKTGSGSMLANARKRLNRTVEEIADELNLSVTQIKTIELDQSEGLPEPTYVRGYIRSYARLVGLDPERVLDNYLNPNWQKGSSLEDMPRGIGSAEKTESKPFMTPVKAIVLLVVAASLGFLWYSGMLGGSSSTPGGSTASNSSLSGSAIGSSTITNGVDPSSAQITQGADPDSVETPGANASTANQTGAGEAPSAAENELVLRFAQTSWVDIRDSDDARLAYKSYAEGEELKVSSNGPMSVFIGNAEGVTVRYNNADFDISEFREGVYAKFTIGEE